MLALPATLPDWLRAQLTADPAAPPLLVAAADLTLTGLYGTEWVVLTATHLLVYPHGAAQPPRLTLALASLSKPTVETLVGGGALLVTVGGEVREVVRFTNAPQREFGRLVKYLQDCDAYAKATAKGEADATAPQLIADTSPPKRCPKCHLLLPEATTVCPACVPKGRVLLRLLAYLKPYWRESVIISLLLIAGMLLSLIPPYLTRPLMDRVLVPNASTAPVLNGVAVAIDSPAGVAARLHLLGWLVAGLLGATLLTQVVAILRGRMLVRLGTSLTHQLRVQLFSHMQFLSLRFFEKKPVGAMIARVTQDTESLENVLVEGSQYFVVNVLTLIGITAVLFVMSWKLALLVLLPVPLVGLLSRYFWGRVHGLWQRLWHVRGRLTATVSDTLSGARVVKAFAKEGVEVGRFTGHSQQMLQANMAAEQAWTTLFPLLWFVASTGSLLVTYFGGREVVGGTLTLGTMMTFIAYLGMFYGPLQFLSRIADYLARSLTAAERVFEILDSPAEVRDSGQAVAMPTIKGRIELQHLTFGYDAHRPVLKDINLVVEPGEMIGLVGQSGAGKSTTINLLCRFYDVNSGAILVDGVNVKDIRLQDLRSQIGVVLQDTFLFNGTIVDNLRYARPDASLADVMAAAKAANAHDFIVSKPDGYETVVGERGQTLSGGERQRLAIARAILHNPRILILDEATASVDTDTEKQIQEAITRLVKGRTTIAIAHRLSTLRHASRLVVLKGGKVEEVGTHEELMAKKGEFFRLVNLQRSTSEIMEVVQ